MSYFLFTLFFVAGVIAAFAFFSWKKKKEMPVAKTIEPAPTLQAINLETAEEKNHDIRIVTLQRQINNFFLVNELSQHITASLSIEESFNHLYRTINSMMDASVVELLVCTDAAAPLLFSNEKYSNQEQLLPYRNHMTDWVLKNQNEIFLEDAEQDYARYVFQPLVLPGGRTARSVMAFPVYHLEQMAGVLCIISFSKNAFELFHKEMIRLLLPFVGVAINNASTHQQIIDLKHRAERSEHFMQQFLANMSHEIRTPMNAVMGVTNLLLQKDPRPEQLKYLNTIQKSSGNLLVILNDILDLSKIEAGKIEFEKIDFSVADMVSSVKDIMQFKAEEKGLQLFTDVDEKIPPVLMGDPTRLTQVLINLVGNAIKFTERGTVRLTAGISPSANRNPDAGVLLTSEIASVRFSVSDTGIGMTTEEQQKLFQDYAQASTDTTRKYGGTGLGLSISKQLVQLQGGTIEVKSNPGEGSTFSFAISYSVSHNKHVVRKEKTLSPEMVSKLTGIRILLADDNEYNRFVARESLELKIEEVRVHDAFDGATAVQMALKNDYDIILMDLVMPQLDGFEATQKIRAEFPSPKNKVPILALTASVIKSEIDKCMAAGMNGFIPKPFQTWELIGSIYQALHGKPEPSAGELPIKEAPVATIGGIVDLQYLLEFTENDPVRLRRYIDMFISKIPAGIASLKSTLAEKDHEKMRIAAHSMKPQLKSMGMQQGLEIAESIEQNCLTNKNVELLPALIEQLATICGQALEEIQNQGSQLSVHGSRQEQ